MREQNPECQIIGDYRRPSPRDPADEDAAFDAHTQAEAYFHTDG